MSIAEYHSCPTCGTDCGDPWHYERQLVLEAEEEDPCGCVPVVRKRA